jgi:hypothetical protein
MGIFCIILHEEKHPKNQPLALGVDPGIKYEGWSVVGTKCTALNGMSEAPTWVMENLKQRRSMRKSRRSRGCPQRAARCDNRTKMFLPPSIKSRWQAKLNIIKHLQRILPIEKVVIEDIKAVTKGSKQWNTSFSPLEQGKKWCLKEIKQLGLEVVIVTGLETKMLREKYSLIKCKNKSKVAFDSHAVDAWALAASETGAEQPSWLGLYYWAPIRLHRRQLHSLQPTSGGERRPYGGTRSMGITRGTLIRHAIHGLTYIGGTLKGRVSLHRLKDGKRMTQNAKVEDIKILTTIHWRARLIPSSQ